MKANTNTRFTTPQPPAAVLFGEHQENKFRINQFIDLKPENSANDRCLSVTDKNNGCRSILKEFRFSTGNAWLDYFDQFWTAKLNKLNDLLNEKLTN